MAIDIIMPVYNSESYLYETIYSVINQSFRDWKLIIVDDCSTDKSRDIILSVASNDTRICPVFLKENGGAAVARNEGLKYVTNQYLCFIDSDDVWLNKKLDLQLAFIKKVKAPIIYTSYWVYDETLTYQKTLIKVAPKKVDYKTYLGNTIIGMSTSMIDLKQTGAIKFHNIRMRQDTYLWITLLKKGNYATGMDEPLVRYRFRSSSISGNKKKAMRMVWYLYRELEKFSVPKSAYFFSKYLFNAIKKHFNLNGYAPFKRLLDFVSSTLLIIIFAIPMVLIAMFILITDGKPIFFHQDRVGKGKRIFKIKKFRTMSVIKDAEKGRFDAGSSFRVTTIGKLLRKTKLDEIPQLINVWFGEMSMVGPRPEVERWTKIYPERWEKVLTVTPGITDKASIVFRNEEELLAKSDNPLIFYEKEILPKKLDLYEQYAKQPTFLNDVKILFGTALAIIKTN